MIRTGQCRGGVCHALALIFGAFCASTAFGQAQPLHDFVKLEKKWPDLVGLSFHVEGRYSIYGADLFYMMNCELPFRTEQPLPKLSGDSRRLEVSGKLAERNGRVYFAVSRVVQLPDYLAVIRDRQLRVKAGDPNGWYEIGDWAAAQARFYGDEELLKSAHESYVTGLLTEARALDRPTPAQLAELADKAKRWELPESVQLEYRHEALRALWSSLKSESPVDDREQVQWNQLAERILKELPGSELPVEKVDSELLREYAATPLVVYRQADEETRRKLHRVFYREVMLRSLQAQAVREKWDGFRAAAAIEAQLPDAADVAESYRARELATRLERAGTLTRKEAVALAEQFRNRGGSEKARQALSAWLMAEEERLRRDGPAGLMKLAREYEVLLEDRERAGELLIEAYKVIPEAEEVTRRLKQLGYRFVGDRWVAAADTGNLPVDPIAQAMREGRVERGMNRDQVRSTLGAPSSVVRIATRGQISEMWTFGEKSASRLVVHFVQNTRYASGRAEVVLISQLPAER